MALRKHQAFFCNYNTFLHLVSFWILHGSYLWYITYTIHITIVKDLIFFVLYHEKFRHHSNKIIWKIFQSFLVSENPPDPISWEEQNLAAITTAGERRSKEAHHIEVGGKGNVKGECSHLAVKNLSAGISIIQARRTAADRNLEGDAEMEAGKQTPFLLLFCRRSGISQSYVSEENWPIKSVESRKDCRIGTTSMLPPNTIPIRRNHLMCKLQTAYLLRHI